MVHLRASLRAGEATKLSGPLDDSVFRIRGFRLFIQDSIHGPDHGPDRYAVGFAEIEVALIVGGDGHDRACPVLHQYEVADPNGHFLSAVRIDDVRTSEMSVFLEVTRTLLRTRVDHLLGSGAAGLVEQVGCDGMLGSENHASSAVDGVDARREDTNFVSRTFEGEVDLRSFRPADPIALHGQYAVRPAPRELSIDIAQKFVGVIGNLPEPLLQRALFHLGVFVAPAAAFHDLLVREHGGTLGAPIDHSLLAIRQAAFEHLQKEPLVPTVVFGLARGDFEVPIVGEAHAMHLALHLRDVGNGPFARMASPRDRGVLRGQTESVPAHRMLDVVAAHPHVPGKRVADRVVPHVTHVQASAWIRKHFDHVILGRGRSGIGAVKG